MTTAWFLMFLARLANLRVDSDSANASRAGETFWGEGWGDVAGVMGEGRGGRWGWGGKIKDVKTILNEIKAPTMHIIVVLQFPPRLSSRMRVSLESR